MIGQVGRGGPLLGIVREAETSPVERDTAWQSGASTDTAQPNRINDVPAIGFVERLGALALGRSDWRNRIDIHGGLMARSVISTKLYVPRTRRGLTTRPRLTTQLRHSSEAALTLVSAPAGFGKTTLLAEWLGEIVDRDRCIAWLSLDAADNEPASFWAYVVRALEGAVPTVSSTAIELLDSSPVPTDMLTTLLNELAAAVDDVWLILDDFHLVDHPAIGEALGFFVEHLPPQVHVVVSTRADPDLPLARWRARGELVEIRAADLRFTSEEASAYLHTATGLDLAADDVAVLEERTEGWVAALQLAALSLRGREDVSGFIARFAGDDRYIVDYLVSEVLAQQPDAVRDFLLQSAILDRLSGPLCDAVTGRTDSSQMITNLERANLFIVALDDRREWYRYHHLFAEVLRARMASESPEQLLLLHQRAGQWYERHGLTEEAVRHALTARDFDHAAHLMELAVAMIRRDRQEALMHGWLTELPADVVRHSPVLGLFYAAMLMAVGDLDGVEPWLTDAERALADVPSLAAADSDDLRTLPSTIAMYRAALAQARGDAADTAAHARRALVLAGPEDHLARGGAAGFLGFAAWADGDVAGALDTFTQAVASLHAAGSLVDALSGTVVLADLWRVAGQPSRGRRLCAQALSVAEKHGARVARATAELHVALSEMDVEVADLDGAEQHLQAAATLSDRAPMTESRYRWFVAQGLLARAAGEPHEALQLLNRAEQLYRPGFFPEVRPIPALRARIWIAQDQLPEAADWASERGVSVTDDARYLSEFDHLTLVRLLLAQHRARPDTRALAQTARLLDRLQEAAKTSARAGSLLEIGLLRSLVLDAQGHRPQAVEALAEAINLASEPASYARQFLDEGAAMLSLLRDTARSGVGGDQMDHLLRLAGPAEEQAFPPAQRGTADALSDRELQVLRLLASELTGPEIARELFVSHNTIRTHTKHIFTKLDVSNRRAAVSRARERGLL
jgi:LuxR family maltose regulon positive regulatory protein